MEQNSSKGENSRKTAYYAGAGLATGTAKRYSYILKPLMTLLKKGHSHRQDAKSAKIFKQEIKNIHLCELKCKDYSS